MIFRLPPKFRQGFARVLRMPNSLFLDFLFLFILKFSKISFF
jgi:hypothetical protein